MIPEIKLKNFRGIKDLSLGATNFNVFIHIPPPRYLDIKQFINASSEKYKIPREQRLKQPILADFPEGRNFLPRVWVNLIMRKDAIFESEMPGFMADKSTQALRKDLSKAIRAVRKRHPQTTVAAVAVIPDRDDNLTYSTYIVSKHGAKTADLVYHLCGVVSCFLTSIKLALPPDATEEYNQILQVIIESVPNEL